MNTCAQVHPSTEHTLEAVVRTQGSTRWIDIRVNNGAVAEYELTIYARNEDHLNEMARSLFNSLAEVVTCLEP